MLKEYNFSAIGPSGEYALTSKRVDVIWGELKECWRFIGNFKLKYRMCFTAN